MSDLQAFHEIMSDGRAMAFWSTPPHVDETQTQEWLAAMVGIQPSDGEDFVIEHEGLTIGKAGFYRFPEIGFILHPICWGRGLATEALSAVIVRAFVQHKLPAIEADVDPRNTAALGLLTRLGVHEIGRQAAAWQVGGEWCDSVYLRLTADRWNRSSLPHPGVS
ncbi:N-acetyltransferase [Sphingomonas prati]|uniref:RimJ/RimL family protein N-acetyltransferase n=2 Tax=Sphingomonas prati TaxID=1843237 RepID=A0A7W9BSF1_9SPHN|nr:RimJ/RimL family protein N-acetyltransferase [Sphingomonas prati]GGE78531.1 N-acetyltransferase [Sphingomonas prati]